MEPVAWARAPAARTNARMSVHHANLPKLAFLFPGGCDICRFREGMLEELRSRLGSILFMDRFNELSLGCHQFFGFQTFAAGLSQSLP